MSTINSELAALEIESTYFDNSITDIYSNKKLLKESSDALMDLLQKIQFTYEEKEKFGFFMNLKLKLSFGLGEKGNWNVNPDKAIETIKATYYPLKKKKLEDELIENQSIVKDFNPSEVYEQCLTRLRFEIAKKYAKKVERTQFKDGKEIYNEFEEVSALSLGELAIDIPYEKSVLRYKENGKIYLFKIFEFAYHIFRKYMKQKSNI